MKKTLFSLLLASSSLAFGQELLFSQPAHEVRFRTHFDIMSSSSLSNGEFRGIFAADDFELAKDSKITKIKFTGHIEDGFLDMGKNLSAWNVAFYEDRGGKPLGIPSGQGGNTITSRYFSFPRNAEAITMTVEANDSTRLNVEWNLSKSTNSQRPDYIYKANTKYWICIYPDIFDDTENIAQSNQKHFFWAAAALGTPNLEHAKVVDPKDFWGQYAIQWTNTKNINREVTGLAFELYGEPTLSTNEVKKGTEISVYPNPTADNLNVKSNKKFKSVSIFNAEGRLVIKTDNPLIDVKKLAVGQYIIHTEFEDGTKSSVKFIKK